MSIQCYVIGVDFERECTGKTLGTLHICYPGTLELVVCNETWDQGLVISRYLELMSH